MSKQFKIRKRRRSGRDLVVQEAEIRDVFSRMDPGSAFLFMLDSVGGDAMAKVLEGFLLKIAEDRRIEWKVSPNGSVVLDVAGIEIVLDGPASQRLAMDVLRCHGYQGGPLQVLTLSSSGQGTVN